MHYLVTRFSEKGCLPIWGGDVLTHVTPPLQKKCVPLQTTTHVLYACRPINHDKVVPKKNYLYLAKCLPCNLHMHPTCLFRHNPQIYTNHHKHPMPYFGNSSHVIFAFHIFIYKHGCYTFIHTNVVHEWFQHKLKYFLFWWIKKELSVICAEYFDSYIKLKYKPIAHYKVWNIVL